MTVFASIAVLLTFIAVGLVVWPLLRVGTSTHPMAATLTALAIPASVLVVYLLISNHDWGVAGAGRAASSAAPAALGSVEESVAALERKLEAAPGDEEGWLLLGSSYLSLNRVADAGNAYQKALDISGGRNLDARLGVAEARIILDPGSLSGAPGDEIEAVLQAEPQNPKGLWYGGLLSLARGQPGVARVRWQALLALQPPERIRQIIESQLAELDAAGGEVAGQGQLAARDAERTAAGNQPGAIGITISVSDALRGQVSASAPLFVFVRDAKNPGPPLAVIRRQASDLPVTLEISDADVMLPGRSLADVWAATVVARVANGGDPMAKPGDVYGESQWLRDGESSDPVAIVIDQVVSP